MTGRKRLHPKLGMKGRKVDENDIVFVK